MDSSYAERPKKYLAVLMAMLCIATFLEGYDFFIVSLIIDRLATEFSITRETALVGVSIINIGAILGFFVVRLGDRIGRRKIFIFSIAAFGTLSLLTSVAASFYIYVAIQFLTKMFLVTEFNIAIIIVSEEFPAKRRGMAVAVLEVAGAIGGASAMLLSRFILPEFGWRGMYLIGGAPIILIPLVYFFMKETRHFTSLLKSGSPPKPEPLLQIWSTPARKYLVLVGSMWFLAYLCYAGLIYHWVLFAKTERGWTDASVSLPLFAASLVGMLGYIVCGIMMDWLGRKGTGVLFFFGSAASLIWVFTAHGKMMVPSLIVGMFFVFALLPLCSMYNAELFLTERRAGAAGWCNFLMGRPAQVAAPFFVARLSPIAGGIGNAVCFLAAGPIIAALLIAKFMPETLGISLDRVSFEKGDNHEEP